MRLIHSSVAPQLYVVVSCQSCFIWCLIVGVFVFGFYQILSGYNLFYLATKLVFVQVHIIDQQIIASIKIIIINK